MCSYKLVRVEFVWYGLQDKVEEIIMRVSLSFIHVPTYTYIYYDIDRLALLYIPTYAMI